MLMTLAAPSMCATVLEFHAGPKIKLGEGLVVAKPALVASASTNLV